MDKIKSIFSKEFLGKILAYAKAHKIITAVVLVVVVYGGYYIEQKLTSTAGETRYVLSVVEKGTFISSITGSGQVSTTDKIDIKPKVSGDITYVFVKAGDSIRAGGAIAQIDSTDAKQAVADAEASLTQAKLQFQKDSAQAPIDYQNSLQALADAKTSLANTYDETFNTLSNLYLDMPTAITGAQNILYGYDFSQTKSQWNVDYYRNLFQDQYGENVKAFADKADNDYKDARVKYDASLTAYKSITRSSTPTALEQSLADSTETAKSVAQAVQSELNLLDAVTDTYQKLDKTVDSKTTTMRTNARTYLSSVNSNLSALLSQQKSVDNAKKTVTDDENNITILKIGNPNGDRPISLQSSEYSISDQERKLQQLRDDLANYTITVPFGGVISNLSVKKYDTVGSGTAVATLITNQKIAELSLNEVDAAKIKLGQKATLTFDAIDGLQITGEVVDLDTAGTVSQGVVTYAVKISFDTEDGRVKPGMSVSASIITDVKENVLMIPNSAVKTTGGATYVLTLPNAPSNLTAEEMRAGIPSTVTPVQKAVEIGSSNDTSTEITNGLSEGDIIISRTITATTQTTAASAPSILNAGRTQGAAGGGNTTFRAIGR